MTDPYLGEIAPFAFGKIPQGWLPCEGQLLDIRKYAALYSLLGAQFGGDGSNNFRLPDLRGRTPIGQGVTATNYSYTVGTYGGVEGVAVTAGNLPSHTHTVTADGTNSQSVAPNHNYFCNVVKSPTDQTAANLYAPPPGTTSVKIVPLNPATISTVGAGAAHSNMQPSLAVSYCICTTGIYPSRP